MESWVDQELVGCKFKDARLDRRFKKLVTALASSVGESIPLACQDWANTKAAYRFLSNSQVSEQEILQGHFDATRSRFEGISGPILVLHDTTIFSYRREDVTQIGMTMKRPTGVRRKDLPQYRVQCGIHMHSSLVVTPEGLPLGLAAIKFFSRKKFKGVRAMQKKGMNSTTRLLSQKESVRWVENLVHANTVLGSPERCVHVGDRESDIYELFHTALKIGTHFLVRICNDRKTRKRSRKLFPQKVKTKKISDEMAELPIQGFHRIEIKDTEGKTEEVALEVRYRRLQIFPPEGKHKSLSPLELTVIYAQEHGAPRTRDRIEWKLITDLEIDSFLAAIEKIEWYAQRWKIETWHKILKSSCKAEDSKLRSAERLAKLISVFCILSWRIFWMTMIHRETTFAPPEIAFTQTEIQLLDHLVPEKKKLTERHSWRKKSISNYTLKLAKLGGYLARAQDSPPGNKVMWRGISRLTDIELGFTLALKLVGN
jgi:hypothetical protein